MLTASWRWGRIGVADAQVPAELLRPRAGRVDDELARELAGHGLQPVAPVGEHLRTAAPRLRHHPRAPCLCELGQQRAVEVAVHEPVGGAVERCAHVVGADVREALGDFLGAEHRSVVDAKLALHRDAALEAPRVLLGVADTQVAVACEPQPVVALELQEHALAGDPQRDVEGVHVLGLDDSHRATRGAAGHVRGVEHHHVAHPQRRQLQRRAQADRPGSEDDH